MLNSARPASTARSGRSAPARYRVTTVLILALALLIGWGQIGTSGVAWPTLPATARADSPAPSTYPLYAWGYNNNGQVGNGTTTDSFSPARVNLPAGVVPTAIAAGWSHSLAIGSDDKLYTWGYNYFGQLGNGTTSGNNPNPTPVAISLSAGVTPTTIAAGDYYSLAIGSNGKLYAWGDNGSGNLGNNTTTNRSTPVTVSLSAGVSPTVIAAGGYDSLAIGSDGNLYTWGANYFGQLGNGTTTGSSIPVTVSLSAGVSPTVIAAGHDHSLAIGSDGKLYAWGRNQYGELGNGTTSGNNPNPTPVVVSLPAGVTPTAIAAGNVHSLAIGSDGKLYAWGYNADGELGNNTNVNSPVPVVVNLPAGVAPTVIAAGQYHSLAIGSDDKLYTWGRNDTGQLGNGTSAFSPNPTPLAICSVAGITHPLLAGGVAHTLAVLARPSQIAASGGNNQNAPVGTAFAAPLVATVRDSANNPVSSLVVTFTAPAGGATGTFTGGSRVYTGTTDASGTVTATTFTANTIAGSYSVTATVSGVITPATFTLTNLVGPAANITASSGGGQSTTVTTFFANPLVVSITDQYNNPVSGTVVTFNPPASGPGAAFQQGVVTATTGADGQATSARVIANSVAGSYNVTATVSGVITPANFALTNTPGTPSALVLVIGDNQQTVISTTFGSPLVAKVTDSQGNAVSGAEVDFAAPTNGTSATFGGSSVYTATTDATGLVTTTTPAANSLVGSYSVTATLILPTRSGVRAGVVEPRATVVQYHLTNLAGCNPLLVTSTGDDGSCGTLRQALVAASTSPTKTVSINLSAGSVISLTTGLTLTSGVSITTTAPCGIGAGTAMLPPVTIKGVGASSGNGLTLADHNQLYGLWVRGFSGVQIKAPVGSSTKMQCVRASKL